MTTQILQRSPDQATEVENKDQAYLAWLERVNSICERRTGLSIHDLEDWCWRDAFDDGDRPGQAFADFAEECDIEPY